jgi:hypothetical protein
MTTLLAVYHKGVIMSGCDKRCYLALQPTELKEPRRDCCQCICGGANHGVGFNKALLNQHQRNVGLTAEALERFAASRGLDASVLLVVDRLRYRTDKAVKVLVRSHFNPPPPLPLFECTDLGSSGLTDGADEECTPLAPCRSEGPVVQGRDGVTGVPNNLTGNPVALSKQRWQE